MLTLGIPFPPQWRPTHNSHAKDTHNFSVVDNLEKSSIYMYMLEVLQTWPSQKKALLTTLGVIYPSYYHLMTFDIDQSTPKFPSSFVFQIPDTIKNMCIYCYAIHEGTSTCVISTKIWKDLVSPTLVPSNIPHRSYDGWAFQSQGLYQIFPISSIGKKTLIGVEVVDAQLDYNILLGRSFMYTMMVIASSLSRWWCFPITKKLSPSISQDTIKLIQKDPLTTSFLGYKRTYPLI